MLRSNPVTDFDVVTGPPWAFSPRACPVGAPVVLQKPADPLPAADRNPERAPTPPDLPGRQRG
jgi:hypothetical protein